MGLLAIGAKGDPPQPPPTGQLIGTEVEESTDQETEKSVDDDHH
jgi:hypothetical protein